MIKGTGPEENEKKNLEAFLHKKIESPSPGKKMEGPSQEKKVIFGKDSPNSPPPPQIITG